MSKNNDSAYLFYVIVTAVLKRDGDGARVGVPGREVQNERHASVPEQVVVHQQVVSGTVERARRGYRRQLQPRHF